MIQEIPYGRYEKTDDSNSELPLSIEVLPHKAIMIHEVYLQRRDRDENRECPDYIKWLIASSFCIPIVIILSSVRLQG